VLPCTAVPLRPHASTSKTGRTSPSAGTNPPHRARTRQQDPPWKADYAATRPQSNADRPPSCDAATAAERPPTMRGRLRIAADHQPPAWRAHRARAPPTTRRADTRPLLDPSRITALDCPAITEQDTLKRLAALCHPTRHNEPTTSRRLDIHTHTHT
jgi:hypothetical protein